MKLFSCITIALLVACAGFAAEYSSAFQTGKVELESAGQLAFGPDGILFVADNLAGAIVALNTGDTQAVSSAGKIDIASVHEKIAALLGTAADQIAINDLAVNPISKRAYLSVSRGRGPDATAVIVTVDGSGNVAEFGLDKVAQGSALVGTTGEALNTIRDAVAFPGAIMPLA